MRRQGERERGENGIVPLPGQFDNPVGTVIDPVAIVPLSAKQGVAAGTAIKQVGGAIADQAVAAGIAGAVDVPVTGQLQPFDLVRQGEIDARTHQVMAPARQFNHPVAGIIHVIGVVASTALHPVGPRTANQPIAAGVTKQRIGSTGAGNDRYRQCGRGESLKQHRRRTDARRAGGMVGRRHGGSG